MRAYPFCDRLNGFFQHLAGVGLCHEQPGHWGLLTSAQWAHLCQQVNATLYTDSQNVRDRLLRTYQVHYSRSGLTTYSTGWALPTSSSRLSPTRPMR